jgi:hypothetical protein
MSETHTSDTDVDKFEIAVTDDVTLARDDMVAHKEHGPMVVDRITISAIGKRARLQSEAREDRMSIELSADELREQWGERIGSDPFEIHDENTAQYSKAFSSKDQEIKIDIEVSGPEDRAEPIMAHLDDSAIRALQAFEEEQPPSECEGRYEIDWENIFEKTSEK